MIVCLFFQAEDGIRDWRDWSSDVCSSDLAWRGRVGSAASPIAYLPPSARRRTRGRACRCPLALTFVTRQSSFEYRKNPEGLRRPLHILGAGVGRVNNSGAGTDGRRKASAGKKKVSKAKLVVDRAPKSAVRRSARNGNGRGHGRSFHVKPAPVRK